MTRILAALALWANWLLFAALVIAAPVPKQPAPKELAADMMLGTWEYSWGSWDSGVISFDKNGVYVAQHVPGSDIMYSGTWVVERDTVTITEYTYCVSTGTCTGGPMKYTFNFEAKDYPKLVGKSSPGGHVALKNPQR